MRRWTAVGSDVSWNRAEAGLGEQRTGRTRRPGGWKGEASMEAESAYGQRESRMGARSGARNWTAAPSPATERHAVQRDRAEQAGDARRGSAAVWTRSPGCLVRISWCVSTRPYVRGECTSLCVACISHGRGLIKKWMRGAGRPPLG